VEYTLIAGTDLKVSRIALGTWAMGGWMWGGTDAEESMTRWVPSLWPPRTGRGRASRPGALLGDARGLFCWGGTISGPEGAGNGVLPGYKW
jgi:hypothetical protein